MTEAKRTHERSYVTELRESQRKMVEGYCQAVIEKKLPLTNHYEEFVEQMANYAGPLIRSGELSPITRLPGDYTLIAAFRRVMKERGVKPLGWSIPRGRELLREEDIA